MKTSTSKINHTLIIPDENTNERLDQALAKLLPDYSRAQIQEWITAGSVLMDGKPVKAKVRVKGGENIQIDAEPRAEVIWEPQPIELNIVYEDEALLVINKPVGMVVHPGAGNSDRTLLNALLHYCPALSALPRGGILHRLDKDTSGLLMIAKTAPALKSLSDQLKKRSLIREYQAVVYGSMISGGKVDAPIERHHLQRKKMAVSDTGKTAITHYRVAEKFRSHTLLKLKLETGRTHQIRVHMSHIHHPLVGDVTYGGRVQLSKGMSTECIEMLRHFKRQALHAFALGWQHPTTGEMQRVEIDLPTDIQHLISVLREDTQRNRA